MSPPNLVHFDPCTPELAYIKLHPLKFDADNVLNRQSLCRGLFDFAEIVYRFGHITHDLPQKFKVKWSNVKVTAWHNVSASKNHRYMPRTDRLSDFKLCKNYPRAQYNTSHMFKIEVTYWNCNNFAAACSISLKFGPEFHHVIGNILQMFKVKDQGHGVKGQVRSPR